MLSLIREVGHAHQKNVILKAVKTGTDPASKVRGRFQQYYLVVS